MVSEAEFKKAQAEVHTAKKASQAQLLALYACFKQAAEGDVKGKQPSRMNFRARAKYDAWAKLKGQSKEQAMDGYVRAAQDILKGGRKAKL